MNLSDPVSKLMTKSVLTISKNSTIKEVEKIFTEKMFHHLPVTEDGELVGIISKSDYLLFKRGFNDNQFDDVMDSMRARTYTAGQIMTEDVTWLGSNDKIKAALELFSNNQFHAIPIVENKIVVGILTTFDIIKTINKDKEITES